MSQMPFAPVWSAMFFSMILMVGLDSQFVQVESVVTAIVDLYPDTLRRGRNREIVVASVCLFDFAIGCAMIMQVSFIYKSKAFPALSLANETLVKLSRVLIDQHVNHM